MIVDDEALAVEYLKDLIPWRESGYVIVGEAANAARALELFEKHRPQIVISDICMPGVDGLEFCSSILALDVSTKILLLTAYREFEYAKKAIELGVANYLLKHELDGEMLLQVLDKLRAELEKENSTNDIIKRHAIMNLIDGNMGADERNDWEFLENSSGEFILLVLKEDTPYPIFERDYARSGMEPDRELKALYEELPEEFNFIEYFKLRNHCWAFLFNSRTVMSQGRLWSRFYTVAGKTQNLLQKCTGRSFSGTISVGSQKIKNITKLYNDAMKALRYSFFIGKGKILNIQDYLNNPGNRDVLEELEEAERLLAESVDKMELPEIDRCIDHLFTDIVIPARNAEMLHSCCDELIRLLNRYCRDNYLPPVHGDSPDIGPMLEACYTAADVGGFFRYVYGLKVGETIDRNHSRYTQKVARAIKFMHENYSKDISVVDIADALEVSDSHLSRIFRNETGQTILEYLTAIRIEAAKNLLDRHNFKIYEISEMVGYRTSQYFSQVFVRMTGINPLEYRERAKRQ